MSEPSMYCSNCGNRIKGKPMKLIHEGNLFDEIIQLCESCAREELQLAFIIYDKLGTPLVYLVKPEGEFTEHEMQTIMDLYPEATDNGESLVLLQEEA